MRTDAPTSIAIGDAQGHPKVTITKLFMWTLVAGSLLITGGVLLLTALFNPGADVTVTRVTEKIVFLEHAGSAWMNSDNSTLVPTREMTARAANCYVSIYRVCGRWVAGRVDSGPQRAFCWYFCIDSATDVVETFLSFEEFSRAAKGHEIADGDLQILRSGIDLPLRK